MSDGSLARVPRGKDSVRLEAALVHCLAMVSALIAGGWLRLKLHYEIPEVAAVAIAAATVLWIWCLRLTLQRAKDMQDDSHSLFYLLAKVVIVPALFLMLAG